MQTAFKKTVQSIKTSFPLIVGILMLISFLNPILEKYYSGIFTGNFFIDPLIGALAGSVSFGIPVVSYVTGGELLREGVSLLAVTAFILAWSTVGTLFLRLEISYISKKFAIWRNFLNFFTSIIIAILTIVTLNIFI